MTTPYHPSVSTASQAKIAYSIVELTQAVPVCRTQIYAEIRAGHLRPLKIGRRTMILATEVERWLAERAATPGAGK